jgi:hypothetical protein
MKKKADKSYETTVILVKYSGSFSRRAESTLPTVNVPAYKN